MRPLHRLSGLLPLLLLGACIGNPANEPAAVSARRVGALSPAPFCRVGADGAPRVVADRGIGGTGAPARARIAERGIGGTGIIGIVTGFASICIDGLEVPYGRAVHVEEDGKRVPATALRAGQVVAIEADGLPQAAYARRIAVMHEVAGRIENVQPGSGLLTIGGQSVFLPPDTWGADRFILGDWVAVSGLRRPDGVIVASRLDASPPHRLLVRGPLIRDGGAARIGNLILPPDIVVRTEPGQVVTVQGAYAGNKSSVTRLAPDQGCGDALHCFGAGTDHLLVEAFVRPGWGTIWLNGRKIPLASGVTAKEGPMVVSLERQPDGAFIAVDAWAADLRTARPPVAQLLPMRMAASPRRRIRSVAPASVRPEAPVTAATSDQSAAATPAPSPAPVGGAATVSAPASATGGADGAPPAPDAPANTAVAASSAGVAPAEGAAPASSTPSVASGSKDSAAPAPDAPAGTAVAAPSGVAPAEGAVPAASPPAVASGSKESPKPAPVAPANTGDAPAAPSGTNQLISGNTAQRKTGYASKSGSHVIPGGRPRMAITTVTQSVTNASGTTPSGSDSAHHPAAGGKTKGK